MSFNEWTNYKFIKQTVNKYIPKVWFSDCYSYCDDTREYMVESANDVVMFKFSDRIPLGKEDKALILSHINFFRIRQGLEPVMFIDYRDNLYED
jgi:hypothetical protein